MTYAISSVSKGKELFGELKIQAAYKGETCTVKAADDGCQRSGLY
ncbi:hypothetical protein [Domibacillus tundrae]|jgi:hypothetical protein